MSVLSVLILAYNHAEYLQTCVETVLNSDIDDLDVQILDDGSTDATAQIGARLANTHSYKVSFETQDNTGRIPHNFNKLLSRARGRYLTIISADDFFPTPWHVKHRVERLDSDEKCVLSVCQGVRCGKDGAETGMQTLPLEVTSTLASEKPETILHQYLEKKHFAFFLQGCIIRTDFFRQIGGFDENFVADDLAFNYKFFTEMVKNGKHHRFDDEVGWCYRIHGANEHKNHWKQLQRRSEVYGHYVPKENWRSFSEKLYLHLKYIDYEKIISDEARLLLEKNLSKEFANELTRRAKWRVLRRLTRKGKFKQSFSLINDILFN